MVEETLSASQENIISRLASSQDEELPSSPILPHGPGQGITKPKKPPTITPRSFTRFFTPKSSAGKESRVGSSRRALRDITAAGSNRQRRCLPAQFADDQGDKENVRSKRRKVWTPVTPAPTPESSSPLKRILNQSLEELNRRDDQTEDSDPVSDPETLGVDLVDSESLPIVERSGSLTYLGRLGSRLRQETGAGLPRKAVSKSQRLNPDWQYETSQFYTNVDDSYTCMHVAKPSHQTIPFCTKGCNTNSLVAIGDEDGGVRLLESAAQDKSDFGKPWVSFRPHANAILDMAFSPDDILLATASGDQTSKVVDMRTQTATYNMSGHLSTVKRVRFQPGSSSILATSSRDGSVLIWDLRCKGSDGPVKDLKVCLDPTASTKLAVGKDMIWERPIRTISEAHAQRQRIPALAPSISGENMATSVRLKDAPSRSEAPGRKGDISVTAIEFLPAPRSEFLLTASEANACVKLWDLRSISSSRRSWKAATPISTSQQPDSHSQHREFGLTSMSLSGDGSKLYTLCRDNTVYAYRTSHLVLGHLPYLHDTTTKGRRPVHKASDKNGLGPIYGFRHPKFHVTTFYVSCALRPAKGDKGELLAVGSSDGSPVLFPTDERYFPKGMSRSAEPDGLLRTDRPRRPPLTRASSGLLGRLNDTIPIYEYGSALVRGHDREVGELTWSHGGELITLSDDLTARCWREDDRSAARSLRTRGENDGQRWGCGWAEVSKGWDDDEC